MYVIQLCWHILGTFTFIYEMDQNELCSFDSGLGRVVGSSALVSKGEYCGCVCSITIVLKCLGESWVWADVSWLDLWFSSTRGQAGKRERQSVEEVEEEAVARMPGRMIRPKNGNVWLLISQNWVLSALVLLLLFCFMCSSHAHFPRFRQSFKNLIYKSVRY